MISRKFYFFFALANSVYIFFIFILDTTLLAKQVNVDGYGLFGKSNYPSFFNINPSNPLYSSNRESNFLYFHEILIVFGVMLLIIYFLWNLKNPKANSKIVPGFKLINIKENEHFIPLKSESQSLEFLENHEITKRYRLSGNLNRVILTPKKNTFLLEDKNFKNALLINRRRLHRKILFNNDILDIGEMVLIYKNNLFKDEIIKAEANVQSHQIYNFSKPRGPIQKCVPFLIVSGSKQEIPLHKNLNTIGTSKTNDIVIDSKEVALRHSKIYKVGKSWKIQNIQNQENTFVNGRRIDQRILKEGDEIAIGDFFFKIFTSKNQIKRQKKSNKESKLKSV